jgi:hypothetical protein
LQKIKNDSIITSPSITNEDEEYCFNLLNGSVMDDDSLFRVVLYVGKLKLLYGRMKMIHYAHWMTCIYVVILFTTMMFSLLSMVANIIKEEEIRALFMFPYYLNFKLLIIICFGYHKVAATYSYIKSQCIGRELDLKVNGFMFCGVLHVLTNTIQFEHTFVSL